MGINYIDDGLSMMIVLSIDDVSINVPTEGILVSPVSSNDHTLKCGKF